MTSKDSLTPVSVCILAHNEEAHIADCLDTVLGWAAEVIVLDAESTDRTNEIVKRSQHDHPELVIFSAPNRPNFDLNKLLMFERATQPWVFYLDADERLTTELKDEITQILPTTTKTGYLVGRKNYYFGQWLRFGGMYPERQPRLFRQGTATFPGKELHETLQIAGELGEVQEPFLHLAYESVSQFLRKQDLYTTVQADAWREAGVRWSMLNHFRYGLFRPAARFLQKYCWLQGFRDGFLGFFTAWMAAQGEFIAYVKTRSERTVV
jgi:glycosyltransferase involved in cell wall biosynthesis